MLSATILVRSTNVAFAESIRWHLRRFAIEPAAGSPSYRLDVYARPEDADAARHSYFLDSTYRGSVEDAYLGDLLGLALWDHWQAFTVAVRDYLLVHAGAVTMGKGAVLLPAPPDAGKSSLTLALLRGGAAYLSDEFGAIDPVTSRVHAVARPLALDPEALEWFPDLDERFVDKTVPIRLSKRFLHPEDVDAAIGDPAPVRAVVIPDPDFRGIARLEPIPRAEALERLASLALNLPVYGQRAVVLLSRLLADAATFKVVGGDPGARAEAISARLG